MMILLCQTFIILGFLYNNASADDYYLWTPNAKSYVRLGQYKLGSDAGILDSLLAISKTKCALLCMGHGDCRSFMTGDAETCTLYNKTVGITGLIPARGFTYYSGQDKY